MKRKNLYTTVITACYVVYLALPVYSVEQEKYDEIFNSFKEKMSLNEDISPVIDSLIDRNRCSDLRDRIENTFLSWNVLSLKKHISSASSYSESCFYSHIEGIKLGGVLILAEKCDTQQKLTTLLSQINTDLSQCQLEYEYAIGKFLYFLHYETEYFRNKDLMKMDPSGELKNALDGFFILYSFIPEKERTQKMWEEVREIGVWEKLKLEVTERFLTKKLKFRTKLVEVEERPSGIDIIAKELTERFEKERIEKEKLTRNKKSGTNP